jgi:hypothetical protein
VHRRKREELPSKTEIDEGKEKHQKFSPSYKRENSLSLELLHISAHAHIPYFKEIKKKSFRAVAKRRTTRISRKKKVT